MKCNTADSSSWPPLILASISPRRKEILEELGYAFEIQSRDVEEAHVEELSPEDLTTHNALLKARAVALDYPQAIVLGADTLVYLDGQPLGKPKTREEAYQMLKRLSGKVHYVCTGVALVHEASGRQHCFSVLSEVEFKELSDELIVEYHRLINPMDKAGAYAIQEESDRIIAQIRGSWNNVKGLPSEQLVIELQSFCESLPEFVTS